MDRFALLCLIMCGMAVGCVTAGSRPGDEQGMEGNMSSRHKQLPKARHVILFIIDGLTVDAIDRIDMPNLRELAAEGCHYREMHLPPPGHPKNDPTYPWSCSMPNPMLMAGTPFIGVEGIRESMIQQQFSPEETAFIVNANAYRDVSAGFGTYFAKSKAPDQLIIEKSKETILEKDPVFMRVHLQWPGLMGMRCGQSRNRDKPYYKNIWHSESIYREACIESDRQLGDFVEWLKEQGRWEGTVLMVCGDHGQADEGWHEPYAQGSSTTPLVIVGTGVVPGRKFEYCEIIDVAPTIAKLLHRPKPPKAIGRVLSESFNPELPEPAVPRSVQTMTLSLVDAHALSEEKQAELKGHGFMTLDDIGQWHTTPAGTNFPAFADAQRKLVDEIGRVQK